MEIAPEISLAGAALVMQISLIGIMAVGAASLSVLSYFKLSGFAPVILGLTLLSVIALLFSNAFAATWTPTFELDASRVVVLAWPTSLLMIFSLDLVALVILVGISGGSRESPFTPMYFIIPPLAIFLRDSMGHVLFYLVSSLALFSLNFHTLTARRPIDWDWRDEGSRSVAYWLVSVLCVVLATLVGFLTRPT